MAAVAAAPNKRTAFKSRLRTDRDIQTEASFVPDCKDINSAYDPLASEQYEHLVELRQLIQACLTMVAGDVYDVVTFKDILFELESELPSTLPVTDMLLLTSRLFRRTAELGRLLSCFFGVVFADDHDDEHFRFAEVRLLQREVRELKRQLSESEQERTRLQEMVDNVGQVAYDHGKAVELLETHNTVLKKQTTALEDQMALLFHQLNTGLETHCKDAYRQVSGEMKVQESLNPTRITFRQTMDSLSEQLRGSRGLISEVREVLLSCSQGNRTGEAYVAVEPSVRFKLKTLDSNFQQLMGRFSAIKETVVETAQELMNALQERKKILYLSFQHIRLYDLQNAKMRNARAILSQLQHNTTEFVQRIQVTFPGGAITSVDRFGNINTQRWQGGYTLATLRGYKLAQQQPQQRGSGSNAEAGSTATGAGGGESVGGVGGGGDMRAAANSGTRLLPGLTEAQVIAAESELAALEGRTYDASAATETRRTGYTGGGTASVTDARPLPASSSSQHVQHHPSPSIEHSNNNSVHDSAASVSLPGTMGSPVAGGLMAPDGDVAPFTSVSTFMDLIRLVDTDMEELQRTLVLDDEMSAFLKMLTLSAAATPRTDVVDNSGLAGRASQLELQEFNMEAALHPTGNGLGGNRSAAARAAASGPLTDVLAGLDGDTTSLSSPSRLRSPRSPESRATTPNRPDKVQSEAALARQAQQLQRQQEQIVKMQEDFTSKIGFLRQVYEARIGDLEVRESSVGKKFGLAGIGKGHADAADVGPAASGAGIAPRTQDPRASRQPQGDRDQLVKMRKDWQQSKRKMQPNRKLREATVSELENKEEDDGDASLF